MKTTGQGLWLRIFVREAVHHGGRPLYEALVALARRENIAGATVFRGIEGFGEHRHLHTTRLLDVSDDLPMIVDFVDEATKIRRFARLLEEIIPRATAVLSPVETATYGPEGRP